MFPSFNIKLSAIYKEYLSDYALHKFTSGILQYQLNAIYSQNIKITSYDDIYKTESLIKLGAI